jgi:hypothetical protein
MPWTDRTPVTPFGVWNDESAVVPGYVVAQSSEARPRLLAGSGSASFEGDGRGPNGERYIGSGKGHSTFAITFGVVEATDILLNRTLSLDYSVLEQEFFYQERAAYELRNAAGVVLTALSVEHAYIDSDAAGDYDFSWSGTLVPGTYTRRSPTSGPWRRATRYPASISCCSSSRSRARACCWHSARPRHSFCGGAAGRARGLDRRRRGEPLRARRAGASRPARPGTSRLSSSRPGGPTGRVGSPAGARRFPL